MSEYVMSKLPFGMGGYFIKRWKRAGIVKKLGILSTASVIVFLIPGPISTPIILYTYNSVIGG